MRIELLNQLQHLLTQKKEVESDLEAIKAAIAELEPQVLDMLAADGISSIRVNGKTMYIHTMLWAGVDKDYPQSQAVENLKKAGLSEYVKESFNTHQLSAYFREQVREYGEEAYVPEGIKLTEKYAIRMRS